MYQQQYPQRDSFEEQRFKSLLNEGIAAVKGGNRELAGRMLEQAAQINSADPEVWLWLSATTDDVEEQRIYLERAVAADPSNAAARRGLVMLSDKLDKSRLLAEGEGIQPRQSLEPEEAQSQAHLCPRCGGHVIFDVSKQEVTCQYCGYVIETEQRLAADEAEAAIDFVMPTTRAHRWAESQQRVACERCGAITILQAGQLADRCPYCGSNRLVQSLETAELIDPQVIALAKIDEQEARQQVKEWLGKGFLSPDDLVSHIQGLSLNPAYYPFWTFDGTLEIRWRCEVNVGSGDNDRWEPRSGTQFEFFDDVIVPGLRNMSFEDLTGIEPFNWKDLVEFSPEYLAGWTALTYDLALSDASLKGREKVMKKLRPTLYATIEPNYQKRNIEIGMGKWSGLTFKNVLLPLWIGRYKYQGKEYRLLINGQTGKVGGKKPRDTAKMLAVTIGAVFILAVMVILLFLWWLSKNGV